MHRIDPVFKEAKDRSRSRKRKRQVKILVTVSSVAAVLVCVIAFGALVNTGLIDLPTFDIEAPETTKDDSPGPADQAAFVPAIIDLPGDPLIINLGPGSQSKVRRIAAPLEAQATEIPTSLHYISDVMISSGQRFVTTLPSSQEDFAYFQLRSGQPSAGSAAQGSSMAGQTSTNAAETDPLAPLDAGAGWGESLTGENTSLSDVKKTRIENTTSIAKVRAEVLRYASTEDVFVRVTNNRSIEDLLIEHRVVDAEAKRLQQFVTDEFQLETLLAGYVVAIRGLRDAANDPVFRPVQLSIYNDDAYIGTAARASGGEFSSGADPWVRAELFNYSGERQSEKAARKYRILDAFYSAAARNKVPSGVIGEAIMLLSRDNDLSRFAEENDRMVLLYAPEGRGGDDLRNRVLYVALQSDNKKQECFSYKKARSEEFGCFSGLGHGRAASALGIKGMQIPVKGVLTSKFGPRRHPILNEVRLHKGVDWAAPVGTPVYAALAGTIVHAGHGGGYGNLLRIKHGGGRETRYAHLSGFADSISKGLKVSAGDLVGYVGTTGLSTGPHLHFEFYSGGKPADPLAATHAGGSYGAAGAVDALIDRIIQIESAGNASAKNPLSTATGLGQFIESTWLRMIRQYRPDLADSLDRQELLDLRTDPTVSREMLQYLTREGESYLRKRGHEITPGNLYLAHFLGMEGASTVLNSPPEDALIDVVGAKVVNANPFLKGKDVDYVINWAARKMNRRGKGGLTGTASRMTERAAKGFAKYKQLVETILRNASI